MWGRTELLNLALGLAIDRLQHFVDRLAGAKFRQMRRHSRIHLVGEDAVVDGRNLGEPIRKVLPDLFTAEEGIGFAYPTQVSYTAAPDGSLVLPYEDHSEAPAAPAPAKSSAPSKSKPKPAQ